MYSRTENVQTRDPAQQAHITVSNEPRQQHGAYGERCTAVHRQREVQRQEYSHGGCWSRWRDTVHRQRPSQRRQQKSRQQRRRQKMARRWRQQQYRRWHRSNTYLNLSERPALLAVLVTCWPEDCKAVRDDGEEDVTARDHVIERDAPVTARFDLIRVQQHFLAAILNRGLDPLGGCVALGACALDHVRDHRHGLLLSTGQ